MKVWCLLILLFMPALGFGQQFYQTTAAAVRLPKPYSPADLEVIPIRPGQLITPENVRASIEALYATGHYRYIEVDATASPAGTELTFNVTPHYLFSTFRLDPANLLDRPISSSLRIPFGEKFSTAPVQRIVEETTQVLEDAGYFNPIIVPEYSYHDDTYLVVVTLKATVRPRATIGAVEMSGGELTFEPEQMRDALDLSPGEAFTADELDAGTARVRAMFTDLGFLNTRIDTNRQYDPVTNTVKLSISVEPGQFAYVAARGYDISSQTLRTLVPVFEEGASDPDLIREGRGRIVEYLQRQGYFEAVVGQPEEILAPLDNAIQINFNIVPGERHKIGTVRIEGANFYSERDLRGRMQIRGAGFLDRGVFSASLLEEDVAGIRTLYRRAGFEEVRVEGRQEDNELHEVDVVIEIVEGPRYPINQLIFSGNQEVDEEELRRHIGITEGDIYTPAQAENARTSLMGMYYTLGFPDVRVEAAADRATDGGKTVSFQISEGPQYRVGKIIVAGNTRTAEKIIRRGSGLIEYVDPYNPEAILEAQQRLYAKGLFNRVEVVTLEHDAGDYRNVLIQVEEARSILVTPGVGVKEYAGPRATLDVSHNNLFGLERSLSLRMRMGLRERQLQVTYREPRLFNHELEGYGSLSFEKTDMRFYEAQRFDFSIQILKRFSANKSFVTNASYQTVDLQDIKLNPIVRRFPDLKGIVHIARMGGTFLGDWRDDVINPQAGSFIRNEFQLANRAWASDVNFVSIFNQSSYYKRAGVGVVALSSRIGWKVPYGEDNELPISERYFAGGSTTLRGYDLDEAGPPGGGQFMTIGNLEYRVPLPFSRLGGLGAALFYDTGNVFERPADFSLSDFTHTAGAGMRYQTPLGPVRFDVGFNLNPKILVRPDGRQEQEEKVQVFFTLGHTF